MTINFSQHIDQVLAEGRALAESIMLETCRITREAKVGDPGYIASRPMDPDTMQYPPQGRVTVYEGRCRVQVASTAVGIGFTEYQAGERELTAVQPEVQVPVVGTEDVTVDHVVEILTSVHDTSLTGRKFTVVARHDKTHAPYRRLRVWEEVA